MAKRSFDVRIEEDGTVAVTTGDMSGEHHKSCDDFLRELEELLGGEVKVKSTKEHHHHHTHAEGQGEHHH